ncbi:MAG: flagellar hook-associated protein FlgK [Cohaesibacter sp.]|jgi:flagellar hook-associated protein 1 FlgK|nr:flagellar hook-associated protein FlgK [Cohaesibacter sp.]
MSLSSAINLATSGLTVTRQDLDVTAGNIANAQTPGYTAKTTSRRVAVGNGDTIGVLSNGTKRSLDLQVQKQFFRESAATQYTKLMSTYMHRVDQTFGEPGTPNALDYGINQFSSAVQGLVTNPDSQVARENVLSKAQLLGQQLNTASDNIQTMRQEIEGALGDSVDTINNALKQIERLNNQIQIHSIDGTEPSALLDERDNYVSQIADLVDIEVTHGENNTFRISTSSGTTLFDRTAVQLQFSGNSNVTAESKWDSDPNKSSLGSITVISDNGNRVDLTSNKSFRSGKVAGLLDLRDNVLVEAQAQLDEIAAGLAESLSNKEVASVAATVGPQTGSDLDLSGLQAGNRITFTYKDNGTGQDHTVTYVRVDSASALPLSNDVTARMDDRVVGIDFSGGMASVAAQIQADLGAGFTVSNPAGNTLRILDDGAANTRDVVGLSATVTLTTTQDASGKLPLFTDGGNGNKPYSGAVDGTHQKVGFASRIQVNTEIRNDPSTLVKFASDTGNADQTRPKALYDALENTNYTFSYKTGIGSKATPANMSVTAFARQVISYQGGQAETAKTRHDGQTIAMNNVQSRMDDISKVNTDTELSRLMELQSAYSANARVLTAVREMLQTLMRM